MVLAEPVCRGARLLKPGIGPEPDRRNAEYRCARPIDAPGPRPAIDHGSARTVTYWRN